MRRVNIRIGDLCARRFEQLLLHGRTVEMRMIETERERAVKTVEVDQFAASDGVHELRAAAFRQINDDAKAIDKDVPLQIGHNSFRGLC